MSWFHGLLARMFGWHPEPTVQAAMQCLHPSWGPCHWRAKGTTPGYKYAGWYAKCPQCGAYAPC